ncbi:helix-turn-helix transcriptional regulator [Natronomonas sp.]|uniref:helix-turn-helix transcriptional regulator n=1 Tax=Natronomonas sp. TaxID=2184060 RepID=UPI002FC2B04F
MSRSRGPSPIAVLMWAFAVALVSAAVLGGIAPVAASDGPAGGTALTQSVDADRVEFRVTVYENGSAEWLFRYEQQLEDDTERQDFEAFAEEFNTNETDLYLNFQDRAESLTASGTNATGREMNAEDFSREARVEERGLDASREFGVVEMSFRWTAFAAEEDGQLVVGDVFDGGLYVGPDQAVVFSHGPNLRFQEVQPEDADYSGGTLAESESVTWEGERSFTDNRPRVVYVEAGSAPATTAGSTTGSDPGLLLPLAALVIVVLLGVVAAVAYRAGMLPPSGGDVAAEADSPDGGAGGVEGGSAGAETAAPGAETDGVTEAAAGATVSEEDLMSDEERVVSLLEDHGGRMKQVKIVDETGWSKSKVSMLLSDMEEEGTISKLRVGRENIVSLSGHEPDAAGSPFDEDDDS